ncbi:MAG: sorbosone dehydrogenase family protein [Thermoanaerobaculia bacterium]
MAVALPVRVMAIETRFRWRSAALGILLPGVIAASACFSMRASSGGGQTTFQGPRVVHPDGVALPEGYGIEAIAQGLNLPSAVAFDASGRPHVVEAGYSYGEVWATPRLLRVEEDGRTTTVASGGNNGPWNGVVFHGGSFYVAEGGERDGGRILRITPGGEISTLVEKLPSVGDHHTNGPAVGPDGWIYFGQGTATNSGIVGEDSAKFGWLARHPKFHDVPCREVTLAGRNFETPNVLQPGSNAAVQTGAYLPFGTPSRAGQIVKGEIPCTGAVMKVPAEGGRPELVAWGLRNPFGLAFSPAGRLYVTENSYDVRGSRPVFGTGDVLWEITPGAWYGWPDHHGDRRLDDGDHFDPPGGPKPELLLSSHPGKPPKPSALFGVHSSANGFDFSRSEAFGHVGQLFVALFGDMSPGTGKTLSPVGFKVVRVDPRTGVVKDFAANKGPKNGPASRIGGGGLERPVAARFDPSGSALYVVDFGVMTIGENPQPRQNTGVLWRITGRSSIAEPKP